MRIAVAALVLVGVLLFFSRPASAADDMVVSATAAYGLTEADVVEKVDVSGDGGLIKLILKKGDGPLPSSGVTVSAHYDGKLTDGKQFDSSYKRGQPFTFPLGAKRVISAWDMSFATMQKGEQAIIVTTAKYGYGDRGAGGAIPGGATLYFKVELISWTGKDL